MVDVYFIDLDKLLVYFILENINILDVWFENLEDFLVGLYDIGIYFCLQVCILLGICFFYCFFIMEDYLKVDLIELLEFFQIGFKLFEVMIVEEIDLLIGSIDCSIKEGQCNRVILEMFYSCGFCVFEFCNLKLFEFYFEEGFIKVEGKGSKQWLVFILLCVIKEIRFYFIDCNLMKIKLGFEDFVFISNFGKNIFCIMVFYIIKELVVWIGLKKKISFYIFCYFFVIYLLEGGVNLCVIQCMLGYESIGIIEIYIYIDCNMLCSEIIEYYFCNIKFREKDNKGFIF